MDTRRLSEYLQEIFASEPTTEHGRRLSSFFTDLPLTPTALNYEPSAVIQQQQPDATPATPVKIVIHQNQQDLVQQQHPIQQVATPQQNAPMQELIIQQLSQNPALLQQVVSYLLAQQLAPFLQQQQQQQAPNSEQQQQYFIPQQHQQQQQLFLQPQPQQQQIGDFGDAQQHQQDLSMLIPMVAPMDTSMDQESTPAPPTPLVSSPKTQHSHNHTSTSKSTAIVPDLSQPNAKGLVSVLVRGARKNVYTNLHDMPELNSLPYKYVFNVVLPTNHAHANLFNPATLHFELLCNEDEKIYVVEQGITVEKLVRSKNFGDHKEYEFRLYFSAFSHGYNKKTFIVRIFDATTKLVFYESKQVPIYARRSTGAGGHESKKRKSESKQEGKPAKRIKTE